MALKRVHNPDEANGNSGEPNKKFFCKELNADNKVKKADKTNPKFIEKMTVRNIIRTDGVNKYVLILIFVICFQKRSST